MRDHRTEDRMESFFLSETTKYLYLLFDTDNFIHNQGQHGTLINTPNGECVINAGGYIFNTEAHPIDPSALHCCFNTPNDVLVDFKEFEINQALYRGTQLKAKKLPKKTENEKTEIVAVDESVTSVSLPLPAMAQNGSCLEEAVSDPPANSFDAQQMLERIRKENKYPKNESWEVNFELLGCRAQKFLQRLSIMGEVFN